MAQGAWFLGLRRFRQASWYVCSRPVLLHFSLFFQVRCYDVATAIRDVANRNGDDNGTPPKQWQHGLYGPGPHHAGWTPSLSGNPNIRPEADRASLAEKAGIGARATWRTGASRARWRDCSPDFLPEAMEGRCAGSRMKTVTGFRTPRFRQERQMAQDA